MNTVTVLDHLTTWSEVNTEEFTAVNLSALARGCGMRRADAVLTVRQLIESGALEEVKAVDPGSHTNVFRLVA